MSIPTQSPPQPQSPYPAEPAPYRNDRTPLVGVVLGAVALVAVSALVIALAAGAFAGQRNASQSRTVIEPGRSTALDAAAIYAAANPGVVDITAHSTTTTAGPFGLPRSAETTDTGTGFVIDPRGHIVTADHVVAGARSVTVTLAGGVTRKATVLGGDPATDVAVLSVDPKGVTLHPLHLGTLAGHRVGDPVAVIGDPFDVQRSLSTGVLSGLDRTIQAPNGYSIPHALQTDAAMNPGNSGGPILDAGGRVIGIADQIATGNSGGDSSTGVGFAVPIDIIRHELASLEAGKVPAHADLGIGVADTASGGGVLVQAVRPGGAAARAGVRAGDEIVGLGQTKIAGVNGLVSALAAAAPGDHTTVTVVRGDKRLTLRLTLGRQSAAPAAG